MSQTPEDIQADIERQREQLAQTVDQLGQKLDVKANTKAKVEDVKAQTQAKVAEVKDLGTTDDGKPRREVLGAAAALVLGVGLLIWLRRRR
jgi:ribosome-binding protein aMBF1 (putative translation factor)